ncbi:ejaculatory bulb-specific protein 1 [Drosophila obscura]|uniref:ejaculatory bulb-specific protein 1 n=1 Tax=Drosophila obscura TaxID=7282 RepID=UPI000BA0BC32|nr:ejaculatory bulb-specific protein 1 [Drosophila obscura]
MARQSILFLWLALVAIETSSAIVNELAQQAENAVQGLADIHLAPLRYLDVLFGTNHGVVPSHYTAAKAAAYRPYSRISAGVGQGSDLITIIKNPRSPYSYGIPGYDYPTYLKPFYRKGIRIGAGGVLIGPNGLPLAPNGLPIGPDGLPISPFGPDGLPFGPLGPNGYPYLPFVPSIGHRHTIKGPSGPLGGGVGTNRDGNHVPGTPTNGGWFGNGGFLGTGLFGSKGLLGTGFLSNRGLNLGPLAPFLNPLGLPIPNIFPNPFGNIFGALGNLFGLSPSVGPTARPGGVTASASGGVAVARVRHPLALPGVQGSITLDVQPPTGLLGLIHPWLNVFG